MSTAAHRAAVDVARIHDAELLAVAVRVMGLFRVVLLRDAWEAGEAAARARALVEAAEATVIGAAPVFPMRERSFLSSLRFTLATEREWSPDRPRRLVAILRGFSRAHASEAA